jgi:YD repeat-containing protein
VRTTFLQARRNQDNFTTGSSYDDLGRVSGAQGRSSGESATATAYNNLDWVLQKVDADGVIDAKSYDAHGNVVSETIENEGTTTSTYDADNRLQTQTDPNGDVLTSTYDAFGNLIEANHSDWNTNTLKDVTTSYDSLARETSQSDSVSGLRHTWTYPQNTASGIQETLSYDGTPLTETEIARNARGVETSRTTTIAQGTTLTRAVADDSTGRDTADRWTSATLQLTGFNALTVGRSFDDADRISSQSGAGFTTAGSYSYSATKGLETNQTLPLALQRAAILPRTTA